MRYFPPHRAFERAAPAARALHASELIPLNVDLPRAVTVAADALPRILAMRERALEELPTINARDFDELHTYAIAAAHAHALFLGTSRSEEDVKALNFRVVPLHGFLMSDALALAKRKLLPAEGVRKLKHHGGYAHAAFRTDGARGPCSDSAGTASRRRLRSR